MERKDLADIKNHSTVCLVHTQQLWTCPLWRVFPVPQTYFLAVFLLKPTGSMTSPIWQGRQRNLISFEVKTIVTSKAGQRMGLDRETTFHLSVLRA